MSTSITRRKQIVRGLQNVEYRRAYVEATINSVLAHQIRQGREHRSWSQEELGRATGVAQATISEWEDPNYGRYTLRTLKRLASAFDVALVVRFAPFSELADWSSEVPESDFVVPSFNEDSDLEHNISEFKNRAITSGSAMIAAGQSVSKVQDGIAVGGISLTLLPTTNASSFDGPNEQIGKVVIQSKAG